nr:Tox-REase-5 domain-containing protein [Glycomyces sp. L485]
MKGLRHGGSTAGTPAASPTSTASPTGQPSEAGRWETPPKRNHGSPINKKYEQWVKTSNGGPNDDREYKVGGVWFDARRLDDSGPTVVETLLDAKGDYNKFVDKDGAWHRWFEQSSKAGLEGLVKEARRQVKAASGRPVEWWCMQEESATLIRRRFRRVRELRGRVKVLYKPLPSSEG